MNTEDIFSKAFSTRWCEKEQKTVENKKVDDFLIDIIKVCEKHDMSITVNKDKENCTVENNSFDKDHWLFYSTTIGKNFK